MVSGNNRDGRNVFMANDSIALDFMALGTFHTQ